MGGKYSLPFFLLFYKPHKIMTMDSLSLIIYLTVILKSGVMPLFFVPKLNIIKSVFYCITQLQWSL